MQSNPSSNPRDFIYAAADEISNMIDNIENGINEVKSRVYSSAVQGTQNIETNFSTGVGNEEFSFDVFIPLT